VLHRLLRLDAALARAERALAAAGLGVLVALVAGKGVLRWFDHGLPWGDELSGILLLWVCFLGASLATRSRRHITVEVLDRVLTPRARAVASAAAGGLAAAFSAGVAVLALRFVLVQRTDATLTTVLKVPLWQVRLVIPIAFALFAWRLLLHAAEDLGKAKAGGIAPHEPAELERRS